MPRHIHLEERLHLLRVLIRKPAVRYQQDKLRDAAILGIRHRLEALGLRFIGQGAHRATASPTPPVKALRAGVGSIS